jgi:hypothetical protein
LLSVHIISLCTTPSGFLLKRSIPVKNRKELSLSTDQICAGYCNGVIKKLKKKKKPKMCATQ